MGNPARPAYLRRSIVMPGPPNGNNNDSFTVMVWLKWRLMPIVYTDVTTTYVYDGYFCLYESSEHRVTRYPTHLIFRIVEEGVLPESEGTEASKG